MHTMAQLCGFYRGESALPAHDMLLAERARREEAGHEAVVVANGPLDAGLAPQLAPGPRPESRRAGTHLKTMRTPRYAAQCARRHMLFWIEWKAATTSSDSLGQDSLTKSGGSPTPHTRAPAPGKAPPRGGRRSRSGAEDSLHSTFAVWPRQQPRTERRNCCFGAMQRQTHTGCREQDRQASEANLDRIHECDEATRVIPAVVVAIAVAMRKAFAGGQVCRRRGHFGVHVHGHVDLSLRAAGCALEIR